ncbi:MAG: hypothetical protein IPJ82_16135 [Lewinellaceae bacterium]|nr:hypothetical protein [Lewinellaceae bacterium]
MSKDPDTIVRIDVDIMASYVRELYDALLSTKQRTSRNRLRVKSRLTGR